MMEWEALEGQAQQHRVPTVWLLREKFQLAMLYAMADQDAFTSLVFQGVIPMFRLNSEMNWPDLCPLTV